jgi:hypothetical protein
MITVLPTHLVLSILNRSEQSFDFIWEIIIILFPYRDLDVRFLLLILQDACQDTAVFWFKTWSIFSNFVAGSLSHLFVGELPALIFQSKLDKVVFSSMIVVFLC